MDVLADLLDGVRARGAVFAQASLDPPWSVQFGLGAPLTVITMLRGDAWIVPAAGDAVPLRQCDIAIVRGPAPFTVADDPGTTPQFEVTPADYCSGSCEVGPEVTAQLASGVHTGPNGISERLLQTLPDVLVVRDDVSHCTPLDLVAEEIVAGRPGRQPMLDRLLDLVLISTLRAWFEQSATPPPWYQAIDDPVVGRALRMLHDRPTDPWTVASLATAAGVSRAALARQFTAAVGEPPMTYLTSWRIATAADLLRETGDTVGSIARAVGYANAFALSVAFKRLRGVNPSEFRAGAA